MNNREAGHDIHVNGVWSLNITGKGVVVAVVDDGKLVTCTMSLRSSDCDLLSMPAPATPTPSIIISLLLFQV